MNKKNIKRVLSDLRLSLEELEAEGVELLDENEIVDAVIQRVANRLDARALADIAFAPIASQKTISAISRAESRREALSLVLTSSEFQRR